MRKKIKLLLSLWVPEFSWMLFIFILSSVPGASIPNLPIPQFHIVVHFFEYSILGFLCMRAFIGGESQRGLIRSTFLSLALVSTFALSDEWHQTFIPGRNGQLETVMFDILFSFTGMGLYLIYRSRKFKSGGKA